MCFLIGIILYLIITNINSFSIGGQKLVGPFDVNTKNTQINIHFANGKNFNFNPASGQTPQNKDDIRAQLFDAINNDEEHSMWFLLYTYITGDTLKQINP